MRKVTLLVLGVITLLAGCATTPVATPTGSRASGPVLQKATRKVLAMEKARAPQCAESPKIKVFGMPAPQPGVLFERWRVDHCGAVRFYLVTVTPARFFGSPAVSVADER